MPMIFYDDLKDKDKLDKIDKMRETFETLSKVEISSLAEALMLSFYVDWCVFSIGLKTFKLLFLMTLFLKIIFKIKVDFTLI